MGMDRPKKPPDSHHSDPPASENGRSEGRRRWGGPPGALDPDFQNPAGRIPDRNMGSKRSKASNITPPALPSPPGFHMWRWSVRDTVVPLRTNTIQMPLILGLPQSNSQPLRSSKWVCVNRISPRWTPN